METTTALEAQRIVAAYLTVVDADAASDEYPCSIEDLPQPKETIRAAFRVAVLAVASLGQLTAELRDYLEVAYVSLADYVDDECRTLLREYQRAGAELAADRRLARSDPVGRFVEQADRVVAMRGRLGHMGGRDAQPLRHGASDGIEVRPGDLADDAERVAAFQPAAARIGIRAAQRLGHQSGRVQSLARVGRAVVDLPDSDDHRDAFVARCHSVPLHVLSPA